MNFFTADTHYGHADIIKPCNRPFRSVNHMNKELIFNYNKIVSPHDTCYFLGDFVYPTNQRELIRRILSKLNGRKILILGNHDTLNPFDYIEYGFESVHTSLNMRIARQGIEVILVHDPALSVIDRNMLFLGGHIHDLFVVNKNFLNVGVDVHNFYPISETKVINYF